MQQPDYILYWWNFNELYCAFKRKNTKIFWQWW